MMSIWIIFVAVGAVNFACESAAAPAPFPSDHPVQLVVLGTKAMKALGIHLPHHKKHNQHWHQQRYQHHPQVEGNPNEEIPALVVNLPPQMNPPHHHLHRRCRHNHRCRCPPGMKKDISGKCRKIWGP